MSLEMETVLDSLVRVQMSFDHFAYEEAKVKIDKLVFDIQQHFVITDERMIELGIPVCFCIDGRGWSTCGAECPRHPPKYHCPCDNKECKGCTSGRIGGCARMVAYGRVCVRCSGDDDGDAPRRQAP